MTRSRTIIAVLLALGTSAAADPKPAADKVTHSGALDFDLVEHASGTFTVRDAAYEVTFAGQPQVEADARTAADGTKIPTFDATYENGHDIDAFLVIAVPKGTPYDVEGGYTGARDGMLQVAAGKVVKEEPITLGSLKGRHVFATGEADGKKLTIEIIMAWDASHHALVEVFSVNDGAKLAASHKTFLASVKTHASAKGPLDGDSATK